MIYWNGDKKLKKGDKYPRQHQYTCGRVVSKIGSVISFESEHIQRGI